MIFSRLSPKAIVTTHFGSMRDLSLKRVNRAEQAVHAIVPLLSAAAAYCLGVSFVAESAAFIVTALSVFGGLLFNLLVSAGNMRMANRGARTFENARTLSKELLANIEYSLLLAFIAISLLIPGTIAVRRIPESMKSVNAFAVDVAAAATIGILVAFGLTMLLVLQRMHLSMTQNIEVTYENAPEVEVPLPPRHQVSPLSGASEASRSTRRVTRPH